MKKIFYLFILVMLNLSFLSCISNGNRQVQANSTNLKAKIDKACYEVVVKKPEKDSLTYEKDLPWDLISYHIRNDKYFPLGTAFAISENELVTAAHVLSLMDYSEIYSDYYIRDIDGNVYEIDQILSFDNFKDFIKFSVKDKKLPNWFNLRKSYETNEDIFAVGNIYGQGLVAVPGTLLGTIPESENGRWLYLKSSPPNDKGSSGGPLLDMKGYVIGIIIAKDNNFSYSLPIRELMNVKKNTGIIHGKFNYRFDLFPESTEAIAFDLDVELPKYYKEVKRHINLAFDRHNNNNMQKLFDDNQSEIFPRGTSSLKALNGACDEATLQVVYKDKNDKNWYFSDLKKEVSSLEKNGTIRYASINSTYYIDLEKPDNISLAELYSTPKLIMDLILKGIFIPRKFANEEIRILSLDQPFERNRFTDSYGRKWFSYLWAVEYSDQVGILVYTPTPDGLVCLLKFIRFSQRELWLAEFKRIVDFIYIPYFGTLSQWDDYLQQKDFLYGAFLDAKVVYKDNDTIYINAGGIEIEFDAKLLSIDDKSKLGMLHDFFPDNGKVVWGIRKMTYSESNKDNYFVLYRHVRPSVDLPDSYKKSWENILQKGHPYNAIPFTEEGRTNIGSVLYKNIVKKDGSLDKEQFVFSIYLGKEGSIKEEKIKADLKTLKDSFKIKSWGTQNAGFPADHRIL
jgi:serine protease Do